MSIGGPQALAALDEALRGIRREEDEVLRKVGRTAERVAKFRDSLADLLRQYAARHLAEQAAGPGADLIAAAQQGRAALRQRNTALGAAGAHFRALEADLVRLTEERSAVLAEIDRHQAALRGLSSRIAATVARDPAFERQQQASEWLGAVAAAAADKARRAELERPAKLAAFQADPLFAYLLERGYGTPAYAGRGLVARLDAWVAHLCRFDVAIGYYERREALPDRLAAHAARQAALAAAANEALEGVERAAIDAAGGSQLRQALGDAQERMGAIDLTIVGIQDERGAAVERLTGLEISDAAGFDAAVAAVTNLFGAADLESLIRASQISGRSADPVLAQLDDVRLRLLEAQTDAHEEQARLATLAQRRRELEDIEYELKAQRFDDPRSLFRDDELTGGRLDAFLTGAIDAGIYWAMWRRSQGWMAGTADLGGGIGLPGHGRGQDTAAPPPANGFGRPREAAVDADG